MTTNTRTIDLNDVSLDGMSRDEKKGVALFKLRLHQKIRMDKAEAALKRKKDMFQRRLTWLRTVHPKPIKRLEPEFLDTSDPEICECCSDHTYPKDEFLDLPVFMRVELKLLRRSHYCETYLYVKEFRQLMSDAKGEFTLEDAQAGQNGRP